MANLQRPSTPPTIAASQIPASMRRLAAGNALADELHAVRDRDVPGRGGDVCVQGVPGEHEDVCGGSAEHQALHVQEHVCCGGRERGASSLLQQPAGVASAADDRTNHWRVHTCERSVLCCAVRMCVENDQGLIFNGTRNFIHIL